MAALARSLRPAMRLLSSSRPVLTTRRGYADEMSFTFAAANQVYYVGANVKQVDVPSSSGSFGILPNHVPTIATLKPGVVTVYEADGSKKEVFVSSGTVTINDDASVQVLAEEACLVEELDKSACQEILSKAQSQLASASSAVEKAEAEIAVEVGQELVRATA
ncbi:ATP synthase subunit delta, mitochondrial [Frankliniella fusca]|uniref:F-ATPase delta subunit n=1 Tax=Frankliniella fusca TaxID=407009 RepID=A0AAE1GW79_9NEOP|nr:ATP synthase subunit delta, mitochondrial [Frankliniella fusca]